MPRVFGAFAVFGGWLCLLLSAVFGLVATQFLGLDHVEGNLPPSAVYGVPAIVAMWIVVAVAIVTSIPVAAAMFAPDPRLRLYVAAAAMGVAGVALLPDDLGRAYAAALLPGAALFAAGGHWIHKAGAIDTGSDTPARADVVATEPAAGDAPESPGSPGSPESPGSLGAPAKADDSSASAPFGSASTPDKRPAGRSARAAGKSRPARKSRAADTECPWCSSGVPAGAERCPSCGAALTTAVESTVAPIPGVTAVSPELVAYQEKVTQPKKRQSILSMVMGEPDDRLIARPTDQAAAGALKPPSAEVRAEMARIDREIAAATLAGAATPEPAAATLEPAGAATPEPAGVPPADIPPTPAS